MKSICESRECIIEFKCIAGQDMLYEVKKLFLEYAQSLEIDLSFQNFEKELETLPEKYVYPEGVLILALVDNKAAGCIALKRFSEDICEMKRLYIREIYRGLGIGKKLINMIIEEGKKLNYRYIRLYTLATMKKAQDLYKFFGFYDIDAYVYNPIAGTRFMELQLKD